MLWSLEGFLTNWQIGTIWEYNYEWNQFLQCKKMNCALMFIISNHFIHVLKLEPCNDKLKVISDVTALCYDMCNSIISAMNFCNAKKMNCTLIFIMSYRHGIKCVSSLLQFEQWNDMFKLISDIMAHCCDMWNTNINAINFCTTKTMYCALMIIMSID